jgi:transposase
MQDTDLYRQILGFEKPWFGKRVEVQRAESRVDIWLDHVPGVQWPCPQCRRELSCRDHAEARVWLRLDTGQFQTACPDSPG